METYNGPRAFLIETRTILFAMVSGLSVFMIIALYMSGGSLALSFDAKDPLMLIALLSLVVCFVVERRKNALFVKLNAYNKGIERTLTVSLEAGDYFDRVIIKQKAGV